MKRIVQVVGARPQFVKLAPVSRALAAARADVPHQEFIAHTGQHYDAAMSGNFFAELGLAEPDINLAVGSGSHGEQTARMLAGLEEYFLRIRPDTVVVYGDTNSTLAAALAAAKLRIALVHVEAGLRSFNRAMPEELNRIAVDHLSDVLLVPTAAGLDNLAREGLAGRGVAVGDVMCDAVLWGRARARSQSTILRDLGLEAGRYGVATVHRAENTGQAQLGRVLDVLGTVAGAVLPVIWPVHPRTRALLDGAAGSAEALRLIDPVAYLDMLALLDGAAFVLTDSGGLQKEAFVIGVPCVTLRGETEWVETVASGANRLVGLDAALALAATRSAMADSPPRAELTARAERLYGGGHAAEAVARAILGARLA